MKITSPPNRPFDVIIIDTIGPMARTENGNEYEMTAICD